VSALRWLWSPSHYWVGWFYGLLVVFAVREFWALGTGRPQDTFSVWVWDHLKISSGEGIGQWTWADFLVFGVYLVIFTWLAGHFFWHKWAG
jgi:hypothetical protein